MSTIHVSLDTNANPPVTCSPANHAVNRGNDSLNWKPAAQQSFTFASLTGLPNPPFTTPTISDDEITVSDNNQNNGPEIDYPYTLCVQANGQTYCTGSGAGGNPGDPIIKNK